MVTCDWVKFTLKGGKIKEILYLRELARGFNFGKRLLKYAETAGFHVLCSRHLLVAIMERGETLDYFPAVLTCWCSRWRSFELEAHF